MPQTSRELVRRALQFQQPERIPRQLWTLPWAERRHPEALARLRARFPSDIEHVAGPFRPSARRHGDAYAVGRFTDEWGCVFENVHDGIVGEVKRPMVEDLADAPDLVAPPYETLPTDAAAARDAVARDCAATPCFTLGACARPWERYQFLRGTENALCDMADPDDDVRRMLRAIHDFYLKELEFWAGTAVDGLMFMDDWGSQDRLLIAPEVWRDLFLPLYRDYIDLAHAAGKFAFMHSDGHILAIVPDLVDAKLDAINSQLFCMDMEQYAGLAKGKITFWGEIDRQHVLLSEDPEAGRVAMRTLREHFYDPRGGFIAQLELGPGANPAVAEAAFEAAL